MSVKQPESIYHGTPHCGVCLGDIWRPSGPLEDGDLVCVQCRGPVPPPQVVGIDPGLNATGVAYWDGSTMLAQTIRTKKIGLGKRIMDICDRLTPGASILVVEIPQVYQDKAVDPNDLISLSLLAGALADRMRAERLILVKPAAWKGQVPKPVHHERIRKRVKIKGSTSLDAMDAVGLCLWGIDHA